MNELLGGKQKKASKNCNLLPFMIGFLTVIVVFAYANAQQENNFSAIGEVVKSELNSVSLEREMNSGEQKQIIESDNKLSEIRNGKEPDTNRKNGQIAPRQEAKRMQGFEGEVSELVITDGFARDSFATNVNTRAWHISKEKDFLIVLKCENGNYDMYLQSSVPSKTGPNGREDSRGLCQLHRNRHSEIVDNPLFRSDWKWQVEKCYEKRKNGTTFYGPDRPIYKKGKYIGICKDVVKNDFTFVSK